MTDAELDALFRKHVRCNDYKISHHAAFVGSAFYDFARELEHRALAAGMMLGAGDPVRPPDAAADPARTSTKGSLLGALWAWFFS
jgi:hypothetical protein